MNGVLVHNKSKTSKFESMDKKDIKIYEVFDLNSPEKVIYVGQTEKSNIQDRLDEHIAEGKKKNNHKNNWDKYGIREVKSGKWTPYEASVWEQYFINKNQEKNNLQNKRKEITKKKYDMYAELHDPC